MTRSWFWPVFLAWLSLFALGLVDSGRGPLYPEILRDFQLSDTAGSFFFLVASLASLIHNTIFYRFLSETDPKRLVGLYTLVMAAGALLISHAPEYHWTLMACVILGIGFGGVGVGQNSAVQAAPKEHRQRAIGFLHAMYGIASFSAPLMASLLVNHGWRFTIAMMSLPSVFVGLLVVFESRYADKRRRKNGHRNVEAAERPALTVTAPSSARWLAAVLIAMLVIGEVSISSRLALLARREWGIPLESANTWLAFYFVAMTVSRLMLGLFRFPISSRSLLYGALLSGIPFLVVGFLPGPTSLRLFALAAYGFPIAMTYPLAMTRLAEIFGSGVQRVTSLCLVLQSAGMVIMHFVLGIGADSLGLLPILASVAIGSLVVALLVFWRLENVVRG